MKTIKLPITTETEMMCQYSGPTHVELTQSEYKRIKEKMKSKTWYFISSDRIKYFDGKKWDYERR